MIRSHEPIVNIIVGEHPTWCIYDGARVDFYNVCPVCGQHYDVEDEADVDEPIRPRNEDDPDPDDESDEDE